MRSPLLLLGLAGLTLSATAVASIGGGDAQPTPVRYARDIRPLLSDRCFLCHGPDVSTRKAKLRLDTFEFATAERKSGPAIVPGDAEASELWRRVTHADVDERMPPAKAKKAPFTQDELELLRRWINEGAEYEDHWAFVAPKKVTPPEGAANPIDAFVEAELARRDLTLAPEAEPELLLRRLFLDLTGLPPMPSEMDSFAHEYKADPEGAWSRWTSRLFQEPHLSRYAERRAAPWMDAARYADTSGIHTDAGRQIWPWRDWVLEAYRSNMPYDEFLTKQLAGDLLPNATTDDLIASGFNRNHVTTDEGGAIDEEYLVEYAVDRVNTTGTVFLGLTMGCARCHDHKFDPITQKDFYRFFAFFNSNDEPGLYSQLPDPQRAFEPFIEVPSDSQVARRAELADQLEALRAELDKPSAEDAAQLAAFRAALPGELGLEWAPASVTRASSQEGADLAVLADGSVLASGANPATDVHELVVSTDATDLAVLQLDVLGDASFTNGAPGRADNGNAVLTSIEVEAVSRLDPSDRQQVELAWAWADYAQDNDDYGILQAFNARANTGWAIAGHTDGAERSALFVAREPFGFEGGTDLHIKLGYESIWSAHVFGHVRVGLGRLPEEARERLPLAHGGWYLAGPFELSSSTGAYAKSFGPEADTTLDPMLSFAAESGPALSWSYRSDFQDGVATALSSGLNVSYLGKELWSPKARSLEVSLGSDDGFALYVNGSEVAAREVPRGVAPDQDRARIELQAGRNTIVFKIVNTGGESGFYFKLLEAEAVLLPDLVAAALDPTWRADPAALDARIAHSWRLSRSPEYRAKLEEEARLVAAAAELETEIPRTMVMREREEVRPAFLLKRGEYDKADPDQPVEPGPPAFLGGSLPEDRRATRLDLAHWMTDPENPIVARVEVNRVWQQLFGTGLVATSDNFGNQGAWPSHPELLDWLAVSFVESGWDERALIQLIVSSKTYRQSSKARGLDAALLANYPAHRLTGEAIRDGALRLSGLLVDKLGGPSVKPYQPAGMWQEVAMRQSNTRVFERGVGEDLWRRSLYTYWKRAAPPPALLTFDAPTRESCEVQRAVTNTPLQALVLWNDEQFVEAARVFGERALIEAHGDKKAALTALVFGATARRPDAVELEHLEATLGDLTGSFEARPEDATKLLAVGEAPTLFAEDAFDFPLPTDAERAAWTLVASAVLNLHATIIQR